MKYALRRRPGYNYNLDLCNGCGPKGLSWLVPDTWCGVCFTEACNIHDIDYIWGQTERDKSEADFRFLKNMFRLIAATPIVRTQTPRWLKRRRQHRAMQYYCAVRDWGAKSFWEGKKKWAMKSAKI